MSIEPYRIDGYCVYEPYRVSIDGKLVRDKKGNPRKFSTMLAALEWGQRIPQKKEWEKAQTLGADVTGQRHLQKKDLEKRK